jgi:hypothetical protein
MLTKQHTARPSAEPTMAHSALRRRFWKTWAFTPPTNVDVHGFVRHHLHGSGNADAHIVSLFNRSHFISAICLSMAKFINSASLGKATTSKRMLVPDAKRGRIL